MYEVAFYRVHLPTSIVLVQEVPNQGEIWIQVCEIENFKAIILVDPIIFSNVDIFTISDSPTTSLF